MKNLKLLACFSLFTFSSSLSFGQSWVWGEGGYGAIKANAISSPVASDRLGNAYLGGVFQSLLILGNDTLKGNGNENAFLAKYAPSGSVIWAKAVSNYYWSYTNAIATDGAGNIYVAGCFSGNAQADTFQLYDGSVLNLNVFLVKYNANGHVVWVRQSNLPPNVLNSGGDGCSVATDNMGNVLISGLFSDTISFGNIILNTKYNDTDAFLVKYDSSGNLLWAKQSITPSNHSSVYTYYQEICSVTTDKSGNSYITGSFNDTISFGAFTLVSPKSYSGFLVKYSPTGNVLWAKQNAGAINSKCVPYSVTTDRSGNPYITGFFTDTIQFNAGILYANGITAFFVKYDTNGNVIWANQSSPGWYGSGLTSDGFNGHIYMAGSGFPQPDSLKFGNYILYTRQHVSTSSFIMEFDTSGNPVCGSLANNLGFQPLSANGIASYYIGITGAYVYTASTYSDTVVCTSDTMIPKDGGFNTFIGKWQTCDGQLGMQKTMAPNGSVLLYPNPSNGIFTLVIASEAKQSPHTIEVYNVLGEKVYSRAARADDNSINLSNQPNGIYLYRVIDENGNLIGEGKLIIQK